MPLTPNLKHSDPHSFQTRLLDDKYTLKRSNSQNEFELQIGVNADNNPFDLGGMGSFHNLIATNNFHEELLGSEIPHLEKAYSVPFT